MLQRLFPRKKNVPTVNARMPDGVRVYAIGDIHGRDDLLDDLLRRIDQDMSVRGGPQPNLVFLGDLIDRGPCSAQVVDRLMRLSAERGNCRFLTGNHEEVFLMALAGDIRALKMFTRIGGIETILSYGISEADYRAADYPELAEMLARAVPSEHVEFLQSFEDLIELGDYAFVHAGVRPGVPLEAQRVSDLRWIRGEFLDLEHELSGTHVIVHGHTIAADVEQTARRIGLDTGAYSTGVLSAMGFEADRRWIIQASAARQAA